MIKKAAILLLLAVCAFGQTNHNGDFSITGTFSVSGGTASAPAPAGTLAARPVNCTQGQIYFATDATAGQNLSGCTTTGTPGTWTQLGGSGGISGLTASAFVIAANPTSVGTPSATSTLDSGGNAHFTSISTGGATSSCNGTAGCVEYVQGTAPSALGTTSIQSIAPTSVTSYRHVWPTAAATGIRFLANSSNTMTESIISPSTAGFVLTSNGASAPTFQAATGGGGTPGTPVGSAQFNIASAFAGQAFTLNGGAVLSGLQRATEVGYITLTQGGNLTLPAQTTPYTVTLATAVSCNTKWTAGLISISTAFTGGTGGITATIQHNAANIMPPYDLTQTGGDINYWDDIPVRVCVGAAPANVTVIFTGDGSHNLSLYTAGAIKIRLEEHKDQ